MYFHLVGLPFTFYHKRWPALAAWVKCQPLSDTVTAWRGSAFEIRAVALTMLQDAKCWFGSYSRFRASVTIITLISYDLSPCMYWRNGERGRAGDVVFGIFF